MNLNKESKEQGTRRMTFKPTMIIIGLALLVSCAKDRPEQISQSAAVNLLEIGDFQGREYDLTTEEPLLSDASFTSAQDVTVEDGAQGINDYRRVAYNTNSTHFDDVPFFGKPKTQYKLKYEITPTYLIINKLSKKENIPFSEQSIAKKIGENAYKVPMIGYPITLYKLRRVLNVNNEATHQFDTDVVQELNQATHFKIDFDGRKPFASIDKNNVFSADLLDGEWFYAATVVSASPEQANSIGRDLSFDFKARSVSRIKFLKQPDAIVGVNLNVDDNLDISQDINLKKALSIPADWFDTKREVEGKVDKLSEVEIGNDHKEAKPFKQRQYMRLKFEGTNSILSESSANAIFESIQMGKDYLSYVVYYRDQEIKIRYSLRKAHAPKKGRVYFKKDRKVFGFFSTRRYVIENHRFHREEDYEKLIFLNRFYPENGKITYFFSHNTPAHMREAGRRSIKVWNDGFKAAKTGIEVVLDESKDVNLGDIRYNIINIVDTKDGARLLGYGPSIVDSESGEIISATSNIYANPFRETWIETLRNYVRSKIGMIDDSNLLAVNPEKGTLEIDFFSKILSADNQKYYFNGSNHHGASSLSRLLNPSSESSANIHSKITGELNKIIKAVNGDKPLSALSQHSNHDEEGMFHQNAFDIVYKDSIQQIEENCKDILNPYIEKLTEKGMRPSQAGELEALNTCADRLLEESVVSTLVHELGHNFGLRHNFLASTDTKNFIFKEDGTPISQTSSIMDYQPGQVTELVTPGKYDVAAIGFGYGNQVETEDKGNVTIDTEQSLADQRIANQKEYKFCTDEHVQRTNPLCQRHDHGVTPLEIAETIINSFNSSYTLYGHRLDRNRGSSSFRYAIFQFSRTFIPLKLIYDQWRFHFREFIGERYEYLQSFTPEKLEAELKKMKEEKGRHAKNFAQYYEASEKIYNFFKEVVYTPALQCVIGAGNGVEKHMYLDFKTLKENIFQKTGLVAKDCMHAEIIAGDDGDFASIIGFFGKFHNEQKVSLDISDIDDYNNSNSVGFAPLRAMALTAMTMRAPMMQHLAEEGFAPNFLDNPNYRKELLSLTQDRIINGLEGERFGFPSGDPWTKMAFNTEKETLIGTYTSIASAINVPGKIEASLERSQPTIAQVVRDRRLIPEGAAVTVFGSAFIYATDGQPLAKELIEKRNILQVQVADFDREITFPNGQVIFNETEKIKDQIFLAQEMILSEAFTVQAFVAHVDKVKALVESAEIAAEAKTYIQSKMETIGNVSEAIKGQMGQDPTIAEMPTLNVVLPILEQNGIPPQVLLTSLVHEAFLTILQQEVTSGLQRIEFKKKAITIREEYEAQLDVITQILLQI